MPTLTFPGMTPLQMYSPSLAPTPHSKWQLQAVTLADPDLSLYLSLLILAAFQLQGAYSSNFSGSQESSGSQLESPAWSCDQPCPGSRHMPSPKPGVHQKGLLTCSSCPPAMVDRTLWLTPWDMGEHRKPF
jgi:hypothetical protein